MENNIKEKKKIRLSEEALELNTINKSIIIGCFG